MKTEKKRKMKHIQSIVISIYMILMIMVAICIGEGDRVYAVEEDYITFSICPKNFMDSWNSETEYNFHMDFINTGNAYDFSNSYYTIDGTRYDFTVTDIGSGTQYSVDVDIPIESTLSLCNIPVGVHYGGNDYTSSEYNRIIYTDSEGNKKTGTQFGSSVDWIGESDAEISNKFLSSGDITKDMAGTWTIYLARQTTGFIVNKMADDSEQGLASDKAYHFRVTLTDTIREAPFTEEIYYDILPANSRNIYPGGTATRKLVTPNSDGQVDFELKAGEVAVFGNMMLSQGTYSSYVNDAYGGGNNGPNSIYVKGEGMIPAEVDATVEELETGYTAKDRSGNPVGIQTSHLVHSVGYFEFINSRDFDGQLSVEKNVKGTNKEFSFKIQMFEVDDDIPTEYDYSGSTSGKITFTQNGIKTQSIINTFTGQSEEVTLNIYEAVISLKGGEAITITGLPSGAEYKVSEEEDKAYKSSSSGTEGTISASGASAVFTNEEIIESTTEITTESTTETTTEVTSEKQTETTTSATTEITTELSTVTTTQSGTETTTEVTTEKKTAIVTETTTESKKTTDKSAQTGDETSIILFVIFAVISLTGIVMIIRRKKKSEK